MQAEKTSTSETVHRCLLVAASVVLALFLIEFPALLDLVDYRTVIGPNRAWWAPNIFDPELLHIHRPHARQSGSSLGGDAASAYQIPPTDRTFYQWNVRYDQNGFRNEPDLKRADMVVIGDSFVEGLTVPSEQLMTASLAHIRGEAVANLGQSAYGPFEELVVLKRYGLPLRPHTVVWMFFEGNDLGDVIGYQRAMSDPPSLWQAFVTRSFTRSAVHEVRYLTSPPAKLPGVKRSAILQAPNGKELPVYFLYASKPLTEQDLGALDETARTLATAHQLLASQGSRLVFVFVPSKFRVFHPFCRFPEESEAGKWVPNDMSERLKKALESVSSEIGYLDLTPNLVDAVTRGSLPYYLDDEHWTPEGHKIAAEALNDYLESPTWQNVQLVKANQ